MLNIEVLRTVPLSLATRQAWASAGCHIIPRKRIESYFKPDLNLAQDVVVVNLGWRRPIHHDKVWNRIETIKAIAHPDWLRGTLGSLLPPLPNIGDSCWGKDHGMKGEGKTFYHSFDEHIVTKHADVQKHIDGVEYRVNTVGNKVIQAHKKIGNVYDGFDWEWVGVGGIKSTGIIGLIKTYFDKVPHYETSVLGWDWIIDAETEKPFLLEVNTSAGVNNATALRIVDGIKDHYSDILLANH